MGRFNIKMSYQYSNSHYGDRPSYLHNGISYIGKHLYIESGPSWQIQATPVPFQPLSSPLQWRHNERDGVSNHQPDDCLLNRLFKRRSKKISKLRVTDLCEGEFPAQRASNAENVSIWWRHHVEQLHKLTRSWVPVSDFRIEPRISQILQCMRQISHNPSFCHRYVHRHVHISVTKWCIVGYGSGALWDGCSDLTNLRW